MTDRIHTEQVLRRLGYHQDGLNQFDRLVQDEFNKRMRARLGDAGYLAAMETECMSRVFIPEPSELWLPITDNPVELYVFTIKPFVVKSERIGVDGVEKKLPELIDMLVHAVTRRADFNGSVARATQELADVNAELKVRLGEARQVFGRFVRKRLVDPKYHYYVSETTGGAWGRNSNLEPGEFVRRLPHGEVNRIWYRPFDPTLKHLTVDSSWTKIYDASLSDMEDLASELKAKMSDK